MVNVFNHKVDIFTYFFFQYPVYATLGKPNKADLLILNPIGFIMNGNNIINTSLLFTGKHNVKLTLPLF